MLLPPCVRRNRPSPPQFALLMSRNRLLRTVMSLVISVDDASTPRMLMPAAMCRTVLFVICTCCTTTHGAPPSWLRGVSTIASPSYAAAHAYSRRLLSTTTRCAFLNSSRFLPTYELPRHAVFLVT